MINVKRFWIHVSKKDKNQNILASRRYSLKPSDNKNELRMKEDIANRLMKLRHRGYWTHWYVVGEIETPEGTKLYRTVIGIHLF